MRRQPIAFATVSITAKAWQAAEPRYATSEGGIIVKKVRLNHPRAVLLTATAGLLAAVGLVVVFHGRPPPFLLAFR